MAAFIAANVVRRDAKVAHLPSSMELPFWTSARERNSIEAKFWAR
jgi:hypothetical protein